MPKTTAAQFFATVGQDTQLTRRFLLATHDKHSAEAIEAIAQFAREIGFDLSFEDIRRTRSGPPPAQV
ncbi:hypothetical protein [Pelagibacterium luteolum]|uniref:Nif11 domain-containing protein n=1 Tax=Pelagibacterium luteolum TaxID=440168 RepID=A0A1G8A310_9HYPH|nr:hypothetical protein [Pelagibacterium luteolum]SDH15276.1 hypothetical protein SAMN04487974_12527 [Pelagibacterium luteolum]